MEFCSMELDSCSIQLAGTQMGELNFYILLPQNMWAEADNPFQRKN
jgi:hypothetical protein